jgi:hypothetical protein
MRRAAVAATLAALLLAGCAMEHPPAGGGATELTGDRGLDSFALIDQAMASGKLDYSTGMLYKVYAMFDPADLPAEYQSDVPAKCGVSLIEEVQRNWNRLTPEARAEIGAYIQPVSSPSGTDTELDDVTPDRLEHERNRLD